MTYPLKVNGLDRSVDVDEDTPLLWVLRDELGLTGTKFGCGIAMCGACTVHMDGQPLRSCSIPISAVSGEITTIEAIEGPEAKAVQAAWIARDVPQCGYCPARKAKAGRPRHRSRDERQYLPLRHLCPHPCRDP
jgi:isoquinoline 1-oxidoreductase alpha subunit